MASHSPYQVKDVVDFVLNNRKEGSLGFSGWTPQDIAMCVIGCMEKNALIYSTDADDMINGVMLTNINGDNCHVINILTVEKGLGQRMVRLIPELFPQCKTLSFQKRGRDRRWPITNSLLSHLHI